MGDTVFGSLHNINHRWVKFDGRVPHAAMAFEGTERFSVVYFTRKDAENTDLAAHDYLSQLGIPIPTKEWLQQSASASTMSAVAGAALSSATTECAVDTRTKPESEFEFRTPLLPIGIAAEPLSQGDAPMPAVSGAGTSSADIDRAVDTGTNRGAEVMPDQEADTQELEDLYQQAMGALKAFIDRSSFADTDRAVRGSAAEGRGTGRIWCRRARRAADGRSRVEEPRSSAVHTCECV